MILVQEIGLFTREKLNLGCGTRVTRYWDCIGWKLVPAGSSVSLPKHPDWSAHSVVYPSVPERPTVMHSQLSGFGHRPLFQHRAMSHMLEKYIAGNLPSALACPDHQGMLLRARDRMAIFM